MWAYQITGLGVSRSDMINFRKGFPVPRKHCVKLHGNVCFELKKPGLGSGASVSCEIRRHASMPFDQLGSKRLLAILSVPMDLPEGEIRMQASCDALQTVEILVQSILAIRLGAGALASVDGSGK